MTHRLRELFASWLDTTCRGNNGAGELISTLSRHGYETESQLLAAYVDAGLRTTNLPQGPALWDGRCVHMGPQLPAAEPGMLWFDTVELSLMVLLPGTPLEEFAPEARHRFSPCRNWLALRPVACWQYAAFLDVAPISVSCPNLPIGVRLLDEARLIGGAETLPILHATPMECSIYRGWFGKRIVDRWDWIDAQRLFGPVATSLWTAGTREWTGNIPEIDVFAAIEYTEIEFDDRDAFDVEEERSPPPEERRFFGPYEVPLGGAAFRSTVDPRTGLLGGPVHLDGLELRRSVTR
ncbi:MAG TPA: hypothetical protein VIV60_24145 [Polyangiaceae bacterium]